MFAVKKALIVGNSVLYALNPGQCVFSALFTPLAPPVAGREFPRPRRTLNASSTSGLANEPLRGNQKVVPPKKRASLKKKVQPVREPGALLIIHEFVLRGEGTIRTSVSPSGRELRTRNVNPTIYTYECLT